jgi:hypothetical protein
VGSRACGEGTQAGRRPQPRDGGAATRGRAFDDGGGGGGGGGARGRRVPPFGRRARGARVAGVPSSLVRYPVWALDIVSVTAHQFTIPSCLVLADNQLRN